MISDIQVIYYYKMLIIKYLNNFYLFYVGIYHRFVVNLLKVINYKNL